VYGPGLSDVTNERQREEAYTALDARCDILISSLKNQAGAEIIRENQASLEFIYPKLVLGELQSTKTGRETMETCSTLAALAPIEGAWAGSPRPHTLVATRRGQLIGIDLMDRRLIMSPTGLVISGSGGGKSVFAGELVTDFIASNDAIAYVIDVGYSQGPLARICGAQHIIFKTDGGDPIPLSSWYYPELFLGQAPDDTQVALVAEDALRLADLEDNEKRRARNVIHIAVSEVYKNEVPRNQPGVHEHEPTLSHLVDMLNDYDWESPELKNSATNIAASLMKWIDHPWLDQPTHPSLRDLKARLVVFEMNSLNGLPQSVRDAMSFRISTRIGLTGGVRRADGTIRPVIVFIDEGHKIKKDFKPVYEAQNEISRRGRKDNQFLLIATQSWEDLSDTPDIIANASVKFIGKQNDEFEVMSEKCNFSAQTRAAVGSLLTSPGNFAQFIAIIGSGHDQVIEELQVELAPAELWIRTTMPDEKSARTRVEYLKPEWDYPTVIAYLASNYPKGLTGAGLTEIDETPLLQAAAA
jgi:hypothetical protein